MKKASIILLCLILLVATFTTPCLAESSGSPTLKNMRALLEGESVSVTFSATATAAATYNLIAAVYDLHGRMENTAMQSAALQPGENTYSMTVSACAKSVTAKVFILSDGYSPVAAASCAIAGSSAPAIVPLPKTHTVKSLSAVDGIVPYSAHWGKDSKISADLSDAPGLAYSLSISNITTFDATPEGYDPSALIEWGKDPGLGVDILRKHGFTGKGAVIAYIDQPIQTTPYHEQYADPNLHYLNTVSGEGGDNSMHGPAVLSLLAGKTIGTAPDAEIYYYAHASWLADQATHAACLYKIIEQNKSLPEDKRIRMVAFSDNIDDTEKNADQFREAVAACEQAGIMVWFCGEYGAGAFLPMSDRSDPENLTWADWVSPGDIPDLVYVPAGSRTTAGTLENAKYIYWSDGGLSWTMPYMLGLYAIIDEIDPTLTQDQIRSLVKQTAYKNSAGMQIVNPVELVATVLERVGRDSEAAELRSDSAAEKRYLYAVMNTAEMSDSDLNAVGAYLSAITDATVLVADAASFPNAATLYSALQADAKERGGTVAGVQIFGTPDMVPAFPITYKVQMSDGVDEGGTTLTDFFYSNYKNNASDLTANYNVMDDFAGGRKVDLLPEWPVIRLPLKKDSFAAFFAKYDSFSTKTGLTKQTIVNFSSPIFAQTQHIDDMGTFLNRMRDEFGTLDNDYRLYGNKKGQYPVTTTVEGDYAAANLTQENDRGTAEFLINGHGQRNNIDRCYFEEDTEHRESLVNTDSINDVLSRNAYYLDSWTCNNGYGMTDNLITAALSGKCVGAFAATTIISNNGVNCAASLEQMKNSNFYYFYYTYLSTLQKGSSRSSSFFTAQRDYATALLADSANGIRADGNYQFNLYNLLAYENFGVAEPNAGAISLYQNFGQIAQTGQSVPKDPTGGGQGTLPVTDGSPTADPFPLQYGTEDRLKAGNCTIQSYTAQYLDNGCCRLTLCCTPPAGLIPSVFNPPDGSQFRYQGARTSGQQQTLIFDLTRDQLLKDDVTAITVRFYDEATGGCFFVYTSTSEILGHKPAAAES